MDELKPMTGDELIAALQAFPSGVRQRKVLMEADAGYAYVGEVEMHPDDDGDTIVIIPVSGSQE